MVQHPNPDPDEDDLEALGTPFYQGNGLSVRALTAEELQQFLDAHANQPTEPLGSGWAALDRPGHPLTVSRIPPGAEPASPQPQPVLPAQHAAASLGHPGRSARTQYRRRRAAELAVWTRSLTWRAPMVLAAGLVTGALAAQAGLPGAGLASLTVAGPGRLAAAVPPLHPGPGLAARRQRRTTDGPAAGPPGQRGLCGLP